MVLLTKNGFYLLNKYTIYTILFCLLGFRAGAQYSISGTVKDASTGAVIEGADVYEESSGTLVSTDKQGRFSFSDLADGTYQLIVYSFEYNYYETTVTVVNKNRRVDIVLDTLSQALSEVEIRARKKEIFALKRLKDVQGTAIYAGKKNEVVVLDEIIGNTAANNARQIYAQVVGLNIYENNDAGLQLNIGGRGLDPNRTANFNTRQNGYDISADVLGYPESYYTPSAEALDQVQVVRGAASLQYGTQFGGLVNFVMKKPCTAKPFTLGLRQTFGSYGLKTTFANVDGTIDRFSYLVNYNYKSGDGYRNNSQFDSHNLYAYARYQLTDRTNLSVESTYMNYLAKQAGGLTDAQFRESPRLSTRDRNWFEVDWKLYSLKLEHRIDTGSVLSLNVFGLDAERNAIGYRGDPIRLNTNPITDLDERNTDGSYRSPRDLIVGCFNNWGVESKYLQTYKWGTAVVGAKYFQAYNTSTQGAGSSGVGADFSFASQQFPDYPNQSKFKFPNRNLALFGEHIFKISDRFTITPGARFEHIVTESKGDYNVVVFDNAGNPISNRRLSDNRILPRSFMLLGVGTSYKPHRFMEVYGNLSQNYRSVTFSDIRTVNPSFIIDPDITDEKGWTFDLGARGRLDNQLSYDVGLYSMLYDNRIGIILDNRANRVRKNIGTALIYGLESYAEWNIHKSINAESVDHKLTLFVNGACTGSQYIDSEENNVKGRSVEFIPMFNLKTGLKLGYKNLLSSLQFTYLSDQYTDAENSDVPPAGDSRSGIIGKIPAYSIVDLSFTYALKQFSIDAGVLNLLDKSYFTRRATGYPGPGIIPSEGRSFYITLGYKLGKRR